jgi:hypothetical protein
MAELTDRMRKSLESGVKVRFFPGKDERTITRFEEIVDLVGQEVKVWKTETNSKIGEAFGELQRKLAVSADPNQREYDRNDHWRQVVEALGTGRLEYGIGFLLVWSSTDAGKYLRAFPATDDDAAMRQGAYDYLTWMASTPAPRPARSQGSRTDKDAFHLPEDMHYLRGVLDIWVTEHLDEAVARRLGQAKRKAAESQKAFDDFVVQCEARQQQKESDLEVLRLEKERILKGLHDTWTENLGAKQTEWTNDREAREKELHEWRGKCEQRMKELEALYAVRLSLKEPADLWAQLRRRHTLTFWVSGGAAVFATLLLIGLLTVVLYEWPQVLDAQGWSFASIKGTVLLVSILSLGAFVISLLSRIALSSLHLARDADERHQLTYIYLALLEEKAFVDETAKPIVLQALFSRADTGLLKGDSSPTMPVMNFLPGFKPEQK